MHESVSPEEDAPRERLPKNEHPSKTPAAASPLRVPTGFNTTGSEGRTCSSSQLLYKRAKVACSLGTPGPPGRNVGGSRPDSSSAPGSPGTQRADCAAGRRTGQQTSSAGTPGRRARATLNEPSPRKKHTSS